MSQDLRGPVIYSSGPRRKRFLAEPA
jgi:hypothetical protein